MVDFTKMIAESTGERVTDPEQIFQRLVRDVPRLPYLRAPQAKVLGEWYAQRTRPDQVVKMNTGSGKTLVALLALQSSLNEGVGTAAYLCPTRQLVTQVVEQARLAGIATAQFESTNDLPPKFVRGQAILVTTFDKVFNGKSVFGVMGGTSFPTVSAGAIVIDDAHSCLSSAREQASISVGSNHALYKKLLAAFKPVLYDQSPGTAASLEEGDPSAVMTIPYWSWREGQANVAQAVASEADSPEVMFAWPLIRHALPLCRAVVSGAALQISPLRLPVERVPFLADAGRRIYFSGSVVDDSVLVRDFGVTVEAATSPILPRLPGDIGERLILAPSLIDPRFNAEWVRNLAKETAERENVVVLVPSNRAAEPWSAVGAVVPNRTAIDGAISALRSSRGNLLVLVNRYDGVDLADDDCRMLILDGVPTGEGLGRVYERTVLQGGSRFTGEIAQRLEQGLGRGVRSNADYCVCILGTPDVATFVVEARCQTHLTPETTAQVRIGLDLADSLEQEQGDKELALKSLIQQCLTQDRGWKQFHLQRVTSVVAPGATASVAAEMASAERSALRLAEAGDTAAGAGAMSAAISKHAVEGPDKGWFLQIKAQIEDLTDPVAAQGSQMAAFRANSRLLRPIQGVTHSRIDNSELSQGERVREYIANFMEPRAVSVAYENLLGSVTLGTGWDQFEDGLATLGQALGYRTDRPEKATGAGPDVLWYSKEAYFVIECKSEVLASRTTISKSEASQLASSVEWFRQNYPDKDLIPILVHPSSSLATDAFCPSRTGVLDEVRLQRLHERVRSLAAALAKRPAAEWRVGDIVAQLKAQGLHAAGGLQEFLVQPRQGSR